MAGTGSRLGWIVLILLGGPLRAMQPDGPDTPPSRELLLYLAEFENGDSEPVDLAELAALPAAALDAEAPPPMEDDDEQH